MDEYLVLGHDRSLAKGLGTVNFHVSSRIDQPGKGEARTKPVGLLSFLLFWNEDQHPGRGFFHHVGEPPRGTAGGNSWEDGSTANLNGAEAIARVLCWEKGEHSWHFPAQGAAV